MSGTTRSDFSSTPGSRVTVRYFAAAKAAAGTDEELVPSPSPATLGALLHELEGRHGPALKRVLPQCSFLVDEASARPPDAAIGNGSVVDIMPPFAGG